MGWIKVHIRLNFIQMGLPYYFVHFQPNRQQDEFLQVVWAIRRNYISGRFMLTTAAAAALAKTA
ncbi:MAG: hypothetical protein ABJX82_00550, partial [Paracoccaceae bacterium]